MLAVSGIVWKNNRAVIHQACLHCYDTDEQQQMLSTTILSQNKAGEGQGLGGDGKQQKPKQAATAET